MTEDERLERILQRLRDQPQPRESLRGPRLHADSGQHPVQVRLVEAGEAVPFLLQGIGLRIEIRTLQDDDVVALLEPVALDGGELVGELTLGVDGLCALQAGVQVKP